MQPTMTIRRRLMRDAEEMRHRRRSYIKKLLAWLEADRDRIFILCRRMKENGLYAPSTYLPDIRCGVLSHMAKLYGYESKKLQSVWLLKTGWAAYWGPVRKLGDMRKSA